MSRRQSMIINNRFTLVTVLLMSMVMIIYVQYVNPDKPQKKRSMNSGLLCQKEVTCFDRVYHPKLLKKGLDLLQKGNYQLEGGMIYSEYMKTILKDKIKFEDVNDYFYKSIGVPQKKLANKFLKIKYEIIENDKAHPNKKTSKSKKCKLYAGYILTSFRLDGKQIYRMQIDFNKYSLEEIKKRIDCTLKAFKHNASI